MKIKVLSLMFLLLGFTSCLKNQADGVQVLDVATYEKKMTQPDVQLVDVRTPEEFSQGHIENAVNIDFNADKFEITSEVGKGTTLEITMNLNGQSS